VREHRDVQLLQVADPAGRVVRAAPAQLQLPRVGVAGEFGQVQCQVDVGVDVDPQPTAAGHRAGQRTPHERRGFGDLRAQPPQVQAHQAGLPADARRGRGQRGVGHHDRGPAVALGDLVRGRRGEREDHLSGGQQCRQPSPVPGERQALGRPQLVDGHHQRDPGAADGRRPPLQLRLFHGLVPGVDVQHVDLGGSGDEVVGVQPRARRRPRAYPHRPLGEHGVQVRPAERHAHHPEREPAGRGGRGVGHADSSCGRALRRQGRCSSTDVDHPEGGHPASTPGDGPPTGNTGPATGARE
jgi:hypothetical protein